MIKSSEQLVAVAMSGGVDSSTAAYLLQKQGYGVVGFFMRLNDQYQGAEDAARKVCQKLKINFYPLDLRKKFEKEVIDYFLNSYKNGLTPNPCVRCNQLIKFNELLKYADGLGADYLVTGHYIKKVESQKVESRKSENRYKLFRAKDAAKDQSYFLYNLTQQQLARVLFPLSEYTKDEIRKIAKKAGLPNLRKESQDICFLSGDHNDFLREHLKMKTGEIRSIEGKLLGHHQGLPLYTIGQRRGVELGGTGPYYVVKTDYKKNILYVSNDGNDRNLFKDHLIAYDFNWLSSVEPKFPLSAEAVIRYKHKPISCVIKKKSKFKYLVKFTSPQRAITSGQSVVVYWEDELLGGGIIE
jgi:tRNA-specific 2-thiouridylase